MSAISGIVFGAALAVYILSHYDSRRVKKVHALVAALVAALTALADFTSTQIPVAQECHTTYVTTTTTTTTTTVIPGKPPTTTTTTVPVTQTYPYETCATKYANDAAPLIFFTLSIILLAVALIEMSLEGMASVWP
jgi:hypothetical protein